ncbi:MAG: DUF6265 family protein [Gemmatimonadota bacterium]|nr:DUF6265 family protein [Gemmatimonadota bacterium]
MRASVVFRAAAFVMLTAACVAEDGAAALHPPLPRPAEGIERAGWLAGCWESATARRIVEEQWMAPRGGTMLGMSRTVRGDSSVDHELIVLRERGDGLAYMAHPAGQPAATFLSTTVSDTLLAFANPAHDFPQRITYRRGPADSLHARIEGERDGLMRGVGFPMRRAPCAGDSMR